MLCAAPDYLARHGAPDDPGELARHRCIGMSAEGNRELWTRRRGPSGGRAQAVPVATRLSINSTEAGIDAAMRGCGVIRAMSYQVAEHLATGRLRRVLIPFEPERIPVNMVFRPHPRRWSSVRNFVDHAVPVLRARLTRVASRIGEVR